MNLQLISNLPSRLAWFRHHGGNKIFQLKLYQMKKPVINLHIENLVGQIIINKNPSDDGFLNDLHQAGQYVEASLKSTLNTISESPEHEPETEYIEKSLSGAIYEILQTDEDVRNEVKKIACDALGTVVFRNSKN